MLFYLSVLLSLIYSLTIATIFIRVIMRRPPVGTALAWLVIVVTVPALGIVFYLLVGERRVGQRRARAAAKLRAEYEQHSVLTIPQRITQVDWSRHRSAAKGINQLGMKLTGYSTVTGCDAELLGDTVAIFHRMIADVDAAQFSLLMEFYIWQQGGLADEFSDALARAAQRGVNCRVLVDAIGAGPWFRSAPYRRLRDAGVQVEKAMPTGLLSIVFGRNDLRLHRKAVIIDGKIGWTGSMNVVDPRLFKRHAKVGQWVDAMIRIEGAAVLPLAVAVANDWVLETDELVADVIDSLNLPAATESKGDMDILVIPTGPIGTSDALLQMLLTLINSAKKELILTTPYFIPDEAIAYAIRGAALRGVNVHLILPQLIDSILARYASRSYFEGLLECGVRIHLYQQGLLHTKAITVDEQLCMFGTANLDMRSLWLNYELSLFIYGGGFATELRQLQQTYMDHSHELLLSEWSNRPAPRKLVESVFHLASPLV